MSKEKLHFLCKAGDEMLKTDWQQLSILSCFFLVYLLKINETKIRGSKFYMWLSQLNLSKISHRKFCLALPSVSLFHCMVSSMWFLYNASSSKSEKKILCTHNPQEIEIHKFPYPLGKQHKRSVTSQFWLTNIFFLLFSDWM